MWMLPSKALLMVVAMFYRWDFLLRRSGPPFVCSCFSVSWVCAFWWYYVHVRYMYLNSILVWWYYVLNTSTLLIIWLIHKQWHRASDSCMQKKQIATGSISHVRRYCRVQRWCITIYFASCSKLRVRVSNSTFRNGMFHFSRHCLPNRLPWTIGLILSTCLATTAMIV